MKKFKCETLQEAWEQINEFLFIKEELVLKKYGGRYGPELVIYDVFMRIEKPWVDPKFDFGRMFGYHSQKWNGLINNYLDRNYLDLVKNEVEVREKKRAKSYAFTFHFKNNHISGKDCLISLTIMRRVNEVKPILVFHVRTSEVTKRLLLDFLLVQRIAEHIFGDNPDVIIDFFCPACFITAEGFCLYEIHRPLNALLNNNKRVGEFQQRVLDTLKFFLSVEDPMEVKYKVNRRSVKQLQTDKRGMPISGIINLQAGKLFINKDTINYPKDCVTEIDRRRYRREQKK